jgi:hypothetical protein
MTSRFSLATLAIFTIGFPVFSSAQSADSRPLPKPLPAYTIEFIQYRPDGTSARHIEAYKSDGSHAIAGVRKDGTFQVDAVVSAKNQSSTLLHHDIRSKTTMYGPSYAPTSVNPEDPTCDTESMIGKDVFLGLPVVKHIRQSSESCTVETWEAPDCGCIPIFTRHTDKDSETGEVTVFETKATKITLREPNPVWFEIPADYDEKPPSQVREVRYAKIGLTMTEERKESLRIQDEIYWSSQANKPVK